MQSYIKPFSLSLLMGLLALCCTACPKGADDAAVNSAAAPGGDPAINHDTASTAASGDSAAPAVDASEVFKASNCVMCHKEDMTGSGLGPALKNIAAEWNRDELLKYVKDASKYEDSGKRLSHDPKYVMVMPPFPGSDADLEKLVDWLLTK